MVKCQCPNCPHDRFAHLELWCEETLVADYTLCWQHYEQYLNATANARRRQFLNGELPIGSDGKVDLEAALPQHLSTDRPQ